MSEASKPTESNGHSKARPEIQRYAVAKGKYSSRLNKNDRPTSSSTSENNRAENVRHHNKNQYYRNDSSRNGKYSSHYYEDDYNGAYQEPETYKKNPTRSVANQEKSSTEQKQSDSLKNTRPSHHQETDTTIEERIETMTFENRKFSQATSNETRAGLIFLQKKESNQDNHEPDSSPRQFPNQSRKKIATKSSTPTNQPQPINQSLRGLTNVTRTLYDPNAPAAKTPPITVIQPTTNVKVTNSPGPTTNSTPSPSISSPIGNVAQTQEFQNQQYFNQELWNQTYGNTTINELDLQEAQAHKRRKQAFAYWMSQIQHLEKSLLIYLNNSPQMEENFRRLMEAKTTLQQAYIHAMMTDIEVALSKNLDAQLWKSCFHNVIERFREFDKQTNENLQVKKCIEMVIEDGERFFLAFIRQLESAFNIDTQLYFNPNVYAPELHTIAAKYALLCTQHCFLNLGDLARYKETNRSGTDYSEARRHYHCARLLYPKNGKSCKQLAILAVMTHRRLDAIYYYVRALATTSLNDSVKQNLIVLFEEARRRLESFEKELKDRDKKNERKIRAGNQKLEIWKRIDGTTIEKSVDDGHDLDSSVSQQELIHWFILNYITVHGKLYTKTGMETYTELCSKMLKQFRSLLRHNPSVFGKQQLVQMMAINMYEVEVAKQVKNSVDLVVRSQYEESSLQLALDMFGLLTEQTSTVLERHLKIRSSQIQRDEHPPIFNSWLKTVFPSLKIFTDWMTCNVKSFVPLPDQLPAEFGPHPNILQSLANVINRMRTIDRTHIPLSSTLPNSVPVILEEDIEMSGFYPLLTLPIDMLHTSIDVPIDEAKDSKRIVRLCFFADYLCGLEKPIFIYDVQQKLYRPALLSSIESEENQTLSKIHRNLSTNSDLSHSEPNSPSVNSTGFDPSSTDSFNNDSDMKELKRKKQLLENQLAERQRQEQTVKDILNTSRPIEIEVVPRYIVLDTNCFVNYRPLIYKLIKLARFNIIIPLIVICELDKLAATNYVNDDSYEHAEMVRRESIEAVKMIEDCFASRERRVQAMTGEGTVLDSIQFRNEAKRNESNDDIILGCCLKYCHDNPREFFPQNKDGAIRLHREVVLITDDRNLRLKAQARNVPVKDFMKFLELAQVNLDK